MNPEAIITFPLHLYRNCARDGYGEACNIGNCMICSGGLASCLRCGAAEGGLASDCPGERLPHCVEEAVVAGEIDYTLELGWHRIKREETDAA